ncbi:MAG: DUF4190 domain-containing protein [Gemmatimonadaceae bacterium]
MSHRHGPPQGQDPYGQQPPVYAQQGYPQPGPPALTGASNGVGIAGLVVGVLACACALVPSMLGIGGLLGLATVVLAVIAIIRVTTGKANNKGMSIAALVLGIVAIVSAVILNKLTNAPPTQAEILECLNNPATVTGEQAWACAN